MKNRIEWIDTAKRSGVLLVVGRILVKPLLGHVPWIYAITLTGSVIVVSLIASEWIIRKVHVLRIMLFGEV